MSILGDKQFGVELAKHLDRKRKMSEWKDISTAPKDGTPVLLYARLDSRWAWGALVGWWNGDMGWIELCFHGNKPHTLDVTHWCPLPPPPKGAA